MPAASTTPFPTSTSPATSQDEAATGKQELYEQVGKIAPTLWRLLIYDVNALYLFENGVRLDLDFYKPSDLKKQSYVYTDAVIAYDPEGILRQSMPESNALQPAEHPEMV